MNEHLQDLKSGGRPMTKLELANKEIERLHSIIKEVREKLESVQIFGLRSGKTLIATLLNDILKILDKTGDDKE